MEPAAIMTCLMLLGYSLGLLFLNIYQDPRPLQLPEFMARESPHGMKIEIKVHEPLEFIGKFQWYHNDGSELDFALNDTREIPRTVKAKQCEIDFESLVVKNTQECENKDEEHFYEIIPKIATMIDFPESKIRYIYYNFIRESWGECAGFGRPKLCHSYWDPEVVKMRNKCLNESTKFGFVINKKSKNQTSVLFYKFKQSGEQITMSMKLADGIISNLPKLYKKDCVINFCYGYSEREYNSNDLQDVERYIFEYIYEDAGGMSGYGLVQIIDEINRHNHENMMLF